MANKNLKHMQIYSLLTLHRTTKLSLLKDEDSLSQHLRNSSAV